MGAETAEISIAWQAHEECLCVACLKGYDIIRCEMCGFRHTVLLPNPADLVSEYRDTYCADKQPPFLVHADDDMLWAELAQNDRSDRFERILGLSRRRLLDIGTGPGFHLKTANSRGWHVMGIEPSRQAAAYARVLGIEVAEGLFSAETTPGLECFHAINLNNVLEHVPDPIAILLTAREILEPGGVICVNVSIDFSPIRIAAAATAGTGEWWIGPPLHLNYFDFSTLCNLLEQLEFDVAEKTTSLPMENFPLMGDNYTADAALGRACRNKRKKLDLSLEASGLIASDMVNAGLQAASVQKAAEGIILKRLGPTEEVADAVVFLASEASSYIMAQTINVNDGLYF